MHSKSDKSFSRRDFLKSLGLVGTGAMLSTLGGHDVRSVKARPQTQIPGENYAAYYYVEIMGFSSPYFDSCTNMGSETDSVEHKVVNQSGREVVQVLPGRLQYKDIFLERGISEDMAMWDWLAEVDAFGDYKKNGSILALDDTYAEIARWDFMDAWPREVSASLKPSDADPSVYEFKEYTVLAVENIQRVA